MFFWPPITRYPPGRDRALKPPVNGGILVDTTSLVRTTGVPRGRQGERVALTGVVLRQRRVKIPELALRVPAPYSRTPEGWPTGGLTIAAPAATLRT
jgi:hypothetical protein